MESVTSKNQQLDLLGAGLLKATALRDDEIERIAGGEELFSGVRARIIADSVTHNTTSIRFAFVHKMVIASAAAAVILVSMFAAMYTSDRATPLQANKVKKVSNIPDQVVSTQTTQPVEISESGDDKSFVKVHPVQPRPQYIKTVEYRPVSDPRRSYPQRALQDQEMPGEFYALADLNPSEEATRNGRIVRVELPRASLVALGVNVPLDSDKQLIKTDLLVGPDGVPRAIRLVE